jgi:hypothetical protein
MSFVLPATGEVRPHNLHNLKKETEEKSFKTQVLKQSELAHSQT